MMLSQAFKLLEPEAEKTAAAAPPPQALGSSSSEGSPSDVAAAGLRRALKEATAEVETSTKTAAQASPLDQLTKLAASVVEDEHAATMKEAQLYGAAVCDGFMVRLAQYDAAAQKHAATLPPTKVASVAQTSAADDFEKFASDHPEVVREAHDLGYEQTKSDLNKLAEAAWLYGHNGTVQWIHKTASDAFVAGFADTARLIEAAR